MSHLTLGFHRVLPVGTGGPLASLQRRRGMVLDLGAFSAALIDANRDRRAVDLHEYLAVRRGGAPPGEDTVLLTFDDGYRDFLEHALPVLRDRGLPAVLFVTKAQCGRSQRLAPVDRWYSVLAAGRERAPSDEALCLLDSLVNGPRKKAFLRARPGEQEGLLAGLAGELGVALAAVDFPDPASVYLDEKALVGLSRSGVAVEAHGADHVLLPSLTDAEVQASLRECRDWIASVTGRLPGAFCYPDGAHDPRTEALVREAGFEVAFTVRETPTNDLMAAPRRCVLGA